MENCENDFMYFWMEDGIMCSKFKHKVNINIEKVKQAIELRHKISNNQPQYWLYDITSLKQFPKEALDYSEKYGQEFLIGTAVIVNSHVTKFLFNTFLQLKKPKIPFQVFTNEEKAKEWIKNLKNKNL